MYYFDQIKKVPLLIIKNNYYSYTPGYTFAIGEALREIKKTCSS